MWVEVALFVPLADASVRALTELAVNRPFIPLCSLPAIPHPSPAPLLPHIAAFLCSSVRGERKILPHCHEHEMRFKR